tara:strand:+ start:4482 stop:5099 length:618 start_codon:yes stop_codon:yes gene_type:complete
MSLRNLSNTASYGNLYSGLSIEICSRRLKAVASTTILFRVHQIPTSDNKIVKASTSGALTGITEAYLLNPVTVWKNHCQTTQNPPLKIARMLSLHDLYRGANVTATRNGISSFISIGDYSALTSPEDNILKKSMIGGSSLVLGGLFTTPFEALRVSQVIGSKRQPYKKALVSSVPGLIKLFIMRATIGPTLHKILYNEQSKPTNH